MGLARPRLTRPYLYALIAIITVVGILDLLWVAESLFEGFPIAVTLAASAIQNFALTIELCAGYWCVVRWRTRNVGDRLIAVFVALLISPLAVYTVWVHFDLLRSLAWDFFLRVWLRR
jgi:hypothetical protein